MLENRYAKCYHNMLHFQKVVCTNKNETLWKVQLFFDKDWVCRCCWMYFSYPFSLFEHFLCYHKYCSGTGLVFVNTLGNPIYIQWINPFESYLCIIINICQFANIFRLQLTPSTKWFYEYYGGKKITKMFCMCSAHFTCMW